MFGFVELLNEQEIVNIKRQSWPLGHFLSYDKTQKRFYKHYPSNEMVVGLTKPDAKYLWQPTQDDIFAKDWVKDIFATEFV